MPLKKDFLLEELSQVRDILKERFKEPSGRTPVICKDDALKEMAKRKPLKKADFKAIQGLGDVFIRQYSEDFLRVIYKHKQSEIGEVKVSKRSRRTLADYKDRLTNISRRNRNLYTGKLSRKLGVDLFKDHLNDLNQFMLGIHTKPLKLTDTEGKNASKEMEQYHRHLTLLYRQVNREERESGSYHLHIAYPFIQGKLQGEGFEIKAPLMFFPVRLTRKGYDFYLSFDKDKDVLFNRDILLANNKFNNLGSIKEYHETDEVTVKNIEKVVVPFLEKNHLFILKDKHKKGMFEPFEDTKKEDFKKVKKGELHLKDYIVLGNYKIHSSKVQEDVTSILENKTYNELLEGLIDDPYKPYDYSKDNPFSSDVKPHVNEENLTYINALNYSQEKVLDLLNTHDSLVIWGPPGTGKSQTITSLIAKQIGKEENVLVVSEKKVALDVIKSRLGYASKFALFMDDAQDKQAFYSQLKNHIDPLPPVRNLNNDKDTYDAHIKKVLGKMGRMHDAFYKLRSLDVPLYELYPRFLTTKKLKDELFPETIHAAFKETFDTLEVSKLKILEKTFDQSDKLKNILIYKYAIDTYPIITKMNLQLTRSEKLKRAQFYKDFEAFKETYDNVFFLKRRKLKKRFVQNHIEDLDYLFDKFRMRKKFINTLTLDKDFFAFFKAHFSKFEKAAFQMRKLSAFEHTYITMLLYKSPFNELDKVHLKHHDIFDALFTGMIEKFEALNQDKVYDLEHYKTLMDELETTIQNKTQMSEETFSMALYQDALNFSNSKRIMDIKRRIDQSKRLSVSKFIDTYQLELFSNIKVWMMTPEVISQIIPLNFAMFDLVIFDEASQMYVEKAIPTIYRAKKVVIAGDSKQLRPSSLGQGRLSSDDDFDEDEAFDITLDAQSLLDLARYKYKESILNYHYRSKYEELISFSNHAFYDGKLMVSPNQVKPKKPPIEYVVCEDGLWDKRQNRPEALKVINIIKKVLREKDPEETLGVITFNTAQRNLIEDLLDESLFKKTRFTSRLEKEMNRFEDGEDRSLFVKNIENVQGDERDIIIFSTAYAKNKQGKFLRQFGWLNNEGGQNRLNVAISRAKKKIFMVTSFYPESLHVEDLKGAGPKRFKNYLQYCHAISRGDLEGAKQVLQQLSDSQTLSKDQRLSVIQQAVLERLEKESLTVHTNIGIGKYKLDFAIEDEVTKDYSLGIILDMNEASHAPDIRDSLYHQEKYLKARGWNIKRVFAPNWYKDANKEMREIRKILREGL
jgi:hypothetical protein